MLSSHDVTTNLFTDHHLTNKLIQLHFNKGFKLGLKYPIQRLNYSLSISYHPARFLYWMSIKKDSFAPLDDPFEPKDRKHCLEILFSVLKSLLESDHKIAEKSSQKCLQIIHCIQQLVGGCSQHKLISDLEALDQFSRQVLNECCLAIKINAKSAKYWIEVVSHLVYLIPCTMHQRRILIKLKLMLHPFDLLSPIVTLLTRLSFQPIFSLDTMKGLKRVQNFLEIIVKGTPNNIPSKSASSAKTTVTTNKAILLFDHILKFIKIVLDSFDHRITTESIIKWYKQQDIFIPTQRLFMILLEQLASMKDYQQDSLQLIVLFYLYCREMSSKVSVIQLFSEWILSNVTYSANVPFKYGNEARANQARTVFIRAMGILPGAFNGEFFYCLISLFNDPFYSIRPAVAEAIGIRSINYLDTLEEYSSLDLSDVHVPSGNCSMQANLKCFSLKQGFKTLIKVCEQICTSTPDWNECQVIGLWSSFLGRHFLHCCSAYKNDKKILLKDFEFVAKFLDGKLEEHIERPWIYKKTDFDPFRRYLAYATTGLITGILDTFDLLNCPLILLHILRLFFNCWFKLRVDRSWCIRLLILESISFMLRVDSFQDNPKKTNEQIRFLQNIYRIVQGCHPYSSVSSTQKNLGDEADRHFEVERILQRIIRHGQQYHLELLPWFKIRNGSVSKQKTLPSVQKSFNGKKKETKNIKESQIFNNILLCPSYDKLLEPNDVEVTIFHKYECNELQKPKDKQLGQDECVIEGVTSFEFADSIEERLDKLEQFTYDSLTEKSIVIALDNFDGFGVDSVDTDYSSIVENLEIDHCPVLESHDPDAFKINRVPLVRIIDADNLSTADQIEVGKGSVDTSHGTDTVNSPILNKIEVEHGPVAGAIHINGGPIDTNVKQVMEVDLKSNCNNDNYCKSNQSDLSINLASMCSFGSVILKTRLRESLHQVLQELHFDKNQFIPSTYGKYQVSESLSPLLKQAFKLDMSLMIEWCKEILLNPNSSDENLYEIHNHLLHLSRPIFQMNNQLKGNLSLAQCLVLIRDQTEINRKIKDLC